MKDEYRSPIARTVRETVAWCLGAILADGDITDEMRPGYADAIEAFSPEDDDDGFDEGLAEALRRLFDQDTIGRLMHESWTQTKRGQGFHHPDEAHNDGEQRCSKCHPDLIPWQDLPEPQKDINRHAFDAVFDHFFKDTWPW